MENERVDIGVCRSLKARVISELGWFDGAKLQRDIKLARGMQVSQYEIDWEKENAAGYSSLLEAEELDGTRHRILMDAGWNAEWIDRRIKAEGVDRLLRDGQIDFLFLSHEHMDHLWGLPAVVKYRPDLTIRITSTLNAQSRELISSSGHTGRLVVSSPGRIVPIFPGCASVTFNMPIILKIQGEQALFFNLEGKGLVIVTGCCHMGVINLIRFARENLEGGDNIYGIFGGLHISPFDQWEDEHDELISNLAGFGIKKLGCHHCTGYLAVEKMLQKGLPVVKGSGRHGSLRDIYLGNGDEIVF
ncbi:MAG: MBL fold metallo-hydrolase [Syntrophomonadaceae bacterium]|nr:MBL fold metallo-hydrolase [Syntrophomonadaceae bacterium]